MIILLCTYTHLEETAAGHDDEAIAAGPHVTATTTTSGRFVRVRITRRPPYLGSPRTAGRFVVAACVYTIIL